MSLQSPWLAELERHRPLQQLTGFHETDVVIIGGGIAGTATAAFTLLDTSLRVTLIEAGKIGHGATGRNAGQMLAEFERPLAELVAEYGFEEVKTGVLAVETAWKLVETLQEKLSLKTPIIHAPGYDGFADQQALLEALENLYWKREIGAFWSEMRIAKEGMDLRKVPKRFAGLWVEDTHASILSDLETHDMGYFALCQTKLACTNSSQLSEEIIQTLLNRYSGRFRLYEQSPVQELHLMADSVKMLVNQYHVKAKQAVMCTNGFERFKIFHHRGIDVNDQFHRDVRGTVSFMQAYVVPAFVPIKGMSYYSSSQTAPEDDPSGGDTFVYLTRRPFRPRLGGVEGLVCVGGPETSLPEDKVYDPEEHLPRRIRQEFDEFLHGSPLGAHADAHHPAFEWHGLMGYTNGRVRCVGREPCYGNLLYNLGCNGIGIMTSIYGGKRTAGLLVDKDDGAHLFNPKKRNCDLPKRTEVE